MALGWLRRLRILASHLIRRERIERELDEEIRSYAQMLADEKASQGLTPEEALRAARIESGGIEQVKEQVRDARSGARLDALVQDFRYGVRLLRRNPVFTLITVVTLALGVGANSALFSVVYALLLRDLPYREADRLVYVSEFWPHEPAVPGPPSPDFANWRTNSRLVEDMQAFGGGGALNLIAAGEPERIQGTMVTSGFLNLIGVQPALGRSFTPEEDRAGATPTVILSDALWRRRFGASPDIIGRTVELDGTSRTVIGVLPPSFLFPDNSFRADLLIPMMLPANPSWRDERNVRLLRVIARIRPGVSPLALRTEFEHLLRRTAAEEPPHFATMRRNLEVTVTPLRKRLTGDTALMVLVLQAAVGFVLLIGCVNVANLQLARSISRSKEMALRAALGAGRLRLLRQVLTENLLTALLGAAAGFLLAYWSIDSLRAYLPADLHLASTIQIDRSVLIFTFAIALCASVLTGVAPALASSRAEANETLKEGSGRATQRGRSRLHGLLIVAEVAMAMVSLVASGLLIRSFLRISALDPGFDPHGVLTMRISLPDRKYASPDSRAEFFSQLLERASSLPGVESAAVGSGLPLIGTRSMVATWVQGRPMPPVGARPSVPIASVSPEYFHAAGIRLTRGHAFSDADRQGSRPVAVVNRAFVEQFFPGQDALGRRILFGAAPGSGPEIVGVAGNVRQKGFQSAGVPTIYVPLWQFPEPEMLLVLRSRVSPASLTSAAVEVVHSIDPNQPVHDVATMEDRIGSALSSHRANTMLMGLFAALSLTLAVIGVFGVLAYFVNRSSHEIGIRMALGATPWNIRSMVLGRGMSLAIAGILLGMGGALVLTRALESMLFEISPTDVATLSAVPILFASIAAVACYLPARWATEVDPMVTLRHD